MHGRTNKETLTQCAGHKQLTISGTQADMRAPATTHGHTRKGAPCVCLALPLPLPLPLPLSLSLSLCLSLSMSPSLSQSRPQTSQALLKLSTPMLRAKGDCKHTALISKSTCTAQVVNPMRMLEGTLEP